MKSEIIEKYRLAIERMINANETTFKENKDNYVRNDVAIFLNNVQERIEDGILFNYLNAETPLCSIELKIIKGDTIFMKLKCEFVADEELVGEYTLNTHSKKIEGDED